MLYLAAALYTACGVSAGVAAMLAAMTTSAVERLDRQDETLRQVVTELARLRMDERRLSDEVGRLREVASRMQGAISAMSEAHEAALHAVATKGFEVGYDARAEEARARVTRLR